MHLPASSKSQKEYCDENHEALKQKKREIRKKTRHRCTPRKMQSGYGKEGNGSCRECGRIAEAGAGYAKSDGLAEKGATRNGIRAKQCLCWDPFILQLESNSYAH